MISWVASFAEGWRAQRRSSRWIAWALTATWLGVIAGLAAMEPALVCTLEAPCVTEPMFAVLLASLMLGLVGLHRAPMVALIALPFAGWIELTQDPVADLYGPWLVPTVVAVSLASAGYAAWVLVGRRRQSALAAAVALSGTPVVVPDELRPDSSSVFSSLIGRVAGAALAAVLAVAALGYMAFAWSVSARHAEAATQQIAVVREARDEGLTVDVVLPDGDVRSLDTADARVYPIGSEVPVLVDGEWARLATEPYDATYWLAAALTLAVIAGALSLGVSRTMRAVAGLGDPHPALGVLAGLHPKGRLLVWAADAGPEDRPLFSMSFAPYGHDHSGAIEAADSDEADEDQADESFDLTDLESLAEEMRRRDPAVLHALPHDGALVPVEVRPEGADPVLLVPLSPVSAVYHAVDPAADVQQVVSGRVEASARMATSATPRVYELPPWGRLGVLAAWIALLAFGVWMYSDPDEISPLAGLGFWGFGLWMSWTAVMAVSQQVVADLRGVHVRKLRGWQSRTWEELLVAESSATSVLLVTRDEDRMVETGGLPGVATLRRIGVRNPADRCAAEINAMIDDPGLRPFGRREPASALPRLLPAVLAMVAWTGAVAFGLLSGII